MPTPSLLIVPSRFKSGKVYSQIPTSGAGDFTVTRATAATRVNASGYIESVASGIPRLDYFASGGTVGCPALLVEPSGSNLAINSQTWASESNWNLTNNITNVTGAIEAPDGTITANAISPTAVTGAHLIYSNNTTQITFVSGTVYTQSAFFKAGTGVGTRVQLSYTGSRFSQLGFANFDLSAGSVTLVSGSASDTNRAASIENYGNGWYRCRFTATCTSNGAALGLIPTLISASGDSRQPSFLGVTGHVLYGWGAQLETGSVATSYIPTTTAAVTRNADVVSVSGAVSGSIGQTEGTLYAEVDVRLLGSLRYFISASLNSNTTDFVGLAINSSNQLFTRIRNKTGSLIDVVASGVTTTVGIHKLACSYSSGNITFALDGVIIGTNTNANTDFNAALNYLLLGSVPATTTGSGQSNFANDRIRAVALYTTRMTNAELAALTTP